MTTPVADRPLPEGRRILALDAARGIAILAMISYHFMWDLYFTGFWEVNAARDPWLRLYAKSIAGSFLIIVGVSLVLAHGRGIRGGAFLKRLAVIAGAAFLVSLGSWFAFPDSFIFFGILHCIAAGSIIALPLVRAPLWAAPAAAVFFFVLPHLVASPALETWSTWWLGLGESPPTSNDYVPLFPWAGFVISGVALARFLKCFQAKWVPFCVKKTHQTKKIEHFCVSTKCRNALEPRIIAARTWRPRSALGHALVFAGKHSLTIYLTHQIVLLGLLIGLASLLRPL